MTAKTRFTISGTTKAPAAPPPPACTSEHVAHLTRWELRENIDAYLSAKERLASAQTAIAALDPVADAAEITTVKALAERIEATANLARTAIAESLLLAWGIAADYEQAEDGFQTPAWGSLGVYIDDFIVWIAPYEDCGKPSYMAMWAELTVVDLESLPTDGDEDRLLESPPCRLLRLQRREPARVIPAGTSA